MTTRFEYLTESPERFVDEIIVGFCALFAVRNTFDAEFTCEFCDHFEECKETSNGPHKQWAIEWLQEEYDE